LTLKEMPSDCRLPWGLGRKGGLFQKSVKIKKVHPSASHHSLPFPPDFTYRTLPYSSSYSPSIPFLLFTFTFLLPPIPPPTLFFILSLSPSSPLSNLSSPPLYPRTNLYPPPLPITPPPSHRPLHLQSTLLALPSVPPFPLVLYLSFFPICFPIGRGTPFPWWVSFRPMWEPGGPRRGHQKNSEVVKTAQHVGIRGSWFFAGFLASEW